MLKPAKFLVLLAQFLPLSLIAQAGKTEIVQWNTRRPSRFIENKGQVVDQNGFVRKDVKYIYSAPGFRAIFKKNSLSYELYTKGVKPKHVPESVSRIPDDKRTFLDTSDVTFQVHRVDIDLPNANPDQIIAAVKSDDYNNYYLQHTGEEGIQKVYYYRQLAYKNAWPGIDLVFYARNEGELKYDIIVHPGGDIKNVKFSYSGADKLGLKDSKLQISTSLGNIIERIPEAYMQGENEKVQIQYVVKDNCVSFAGSYDPAKSLIIDPQVMWSTYLGGSSDDVLYDVDVDASNNVFGAGFSYSTGLATSGTFQSSSGGNADALIVKFTASGSVAWCTYFGGTASDQAYTCAIGKSGDLYIGGEFYSSGMASSGAYLTTQVNGFFAKFSNSGSRLWSTYYGARRISDCAVDTLDNVYMTGFVCCPYTGFASPNAYQTKFGGAYDAFLLKFTSKGTRSWATYFGDHYLETGEGCALDKFGNVYLVGAGKRDTSYKHKMDGFLVKFDTSGKYKWLNHIGLYGVPDDDCQSVCTDPDGNIYVTGYTESADTIVTNQAYQKKIAGNKDAYVMKVTPEGSKVWATYFGGTGAEDALSIRRDKHGDLLISGTVYGTDGIATSSAVQNSYGGNGDAYIARFTSEGRLSYGTYFGGSGGERGFGIVPDTSDRVFLCGFTYSTSNVATSGAHQTTFGGGNDDGFIAGFKLQASIDASIARINLADTFCSGKTNVQVILHNRGLSRLDSVKINWSINGTSETPYMWKGKLKPDSMINAGLGIIKFDSGFYHIKVWVSKPNNTVDSFPDNDTVSGIFKVVFRSAPDFTFSSRCLDSAMTFINKTTISTDIKNYLWDFGDSTTSTSNNPTKAYKKPGKYSVKLVTVNVNGCRDSVGKTVNVYPKAEVSFSAANSCLKDSIRFVNTSSISSDTVIAYKWSFGDGATSTLVSPVKVYSKPGTYTVWLKAGSNHGCTDSISKSVIVYPWPMIKFSANNACAKDLVSFQNASSVSGDTISFYQWKFGDGDTSLAVNPVHTYNAPGKYLITLTGITNHGCADSFSQTITIHELPKADFSFTNVCLGENIAFTNTTSSADSIIYNSWSFGDGKTSTTINPAKKYFSPGTYDVKLIVKTSNGCLDSVSKKVTIYPRPKAAFSVASICINDNASPVNKSIVLGDTITKYLWNFGDGTTSTLANPSHRYLAAGTYTITLKVQSSKGCADSTTNLITVNLMPKAGFTAVNTCLPDTTMFLDSSKLASKWLWSFGDSAFSSIQNPTHKYSTPGKYNVSLIATSARGCMDTFTSQIEIFETPKADFSVIDECLSDSVRPLNSSKHATGYFWQFGDGTTSTLEDPGHLFKTAGTYAIRLVVTNNGKCIDSIRKNVTIHSLPKLTIRDTVSERSVKFVVSDSSYEAYAWSFGDGDSSRDKNPFHRYPGIGTYYVDLSVTDLNGCLQTFEDTVDILTNGLTGMKKPDLHVSVYPNPFKEQTSIVYTLTNSSKVSISLFDICGRMYQMVQPRREVQGHHEYILNGKETNLKPGLYLLEIKVDDAPFFLRVVKL